ncbi:hypothetical protein ABNC15_19885, partial [Paenibacillus larvae]
PKGPYRGAASRAGKIRASKITFGFARHGNAYAPGPVPIHKRSLCGRTNHATTATPPLKGVKTRWH